MSGRLPNFLIIGVAKCGTTSLADWLRVHPQAFMTAEKELEFFTRDWEQGLGVYTPHFEDAGDAIAVGEATPLYVTYPEAIRRIARTLPDVKLIVLFRDPVSRTFSHWRNRHLRFGGKAQAGDAVETRDFPTVVREELAAGVQLPKPGGYDYRDLHFLPQGHYAEQLEEVYRHFPRENVLVIVMEDMAADPAAVFAETCRFLGIDDSMRPEGLGSRSNAHREFRPLWLWILFLRVKLFQRLPDRIGKFIALKLMLRERPYEPMDPETKRLLQEYFEEPNRRLAEMLGRELPWGAARQSTGVR